MNEGAGATIARINALKRETGTVILAHYYQVLDVQDTGDFIGDSLDLSRKAASVTGASNLLYAAVDFMAEVGKILNPARTVLMPDPAASCPMANQLRASAVRACKEQHPGIPVVLYINTLAEAKAECDVICTSANAVQVAKAIAEREDVDTIIMGPDVNLAHHVRQRTGLNVIAVPERGCCYVHDQFILEDLQLQAQRHPGARVIVHPECKPEIQAAADFVGSTSQLIKHVEDHPEIAEFIIGTEQGMIDHLQRKHPRLRLHSLAASPAGIACRNMKKTTLDNVLALLLKVQAGDVAGHEVRVDETIAAKARKAIDAMLDLVR